MRAPTPRSVFAAGRPRAAILGLAVLSLALGMLGLRAAAPAGAQGAATPTPEACFDCDLAGTRAAAQLLARNGQGLPTVGDERAVVHAVLFWMTGCGACHYVLDTVLPPLEQQFGAQLEVTRIEVRSADEVDALMGLAQDYGIARGRVGVPLLIVGGEVMIGSHEILSGFGTRVERHLAQGGVAYPDHPALAPHLPAGAPVAAVEAAPDAAPEAGAAAGRISAGAAWAIVAALSVLGALAIVAVRQARRRWLERNG